MGFQRAANSSKAASTNPAGRCGHGYMYGQASAPENVAWARNPKFADAFAANCSCSTAQACRARGFPFAPQSAKGNPRARQACAVEQLQFAAKAAANLGVRAHATLSGALALPLMYPWPPRPPG